MKSRNKFKPHTTADEAPKAKKAKIKLDTSLEDQPNNLLHGLKLADMLQALVDEYGWEYLGDKIDIRCFNFDPSVKSSLKFLRRTAWARNKVEKLYIDTFTKK